MKKKLVCCRQPAEGNENLLNLYHFLVKIGKIIKWNKAEGATQVGDTGIKTVLFLKCLTKVNNLLVTHSGCSKCYFEYKD